VSIGRHRRILAHGGWRNVRGSRSPTRSIKGGPEASRGDRRPSRIDLGQQRELAKLAEVRRAAVVVEDRYGNLLKHAYAPAGFLQEMLARRRP